MKDYDVIIVGAGAAGLMCAIEAGSRGRKVLLIDHAKNAAEKIRISGGGRCNFTNIHTSPQNFLSENPRFCISALKRFSPDDFVARVDEAKIEWHEKTLGQLFCDGKSHQIIAMLLDAATAADITLKLETSVKRYEKTDHGFDVYTSSGLCHCSSLVVATGGKSIPKMGATGFGYDVAKQFGLNIIEPRAGLVPLTFDEETKRRLSDLSGVSLDVEVKHTKTKFSEALLFTHRGLSGPAILQISSYWREGQEIEINLAPEFDVAKSLLVTKTEKPRSALRTELGQSLPGRLAASIADEFGDPERLADMPNKIIQSVGDRVNRWRVRPHGNEGYRTAEVTLGGVDTKELSSQTMETKKVPGLYFIGEVVDVTGHLGGFNFQWAWASGFSAGQTV
jgi:predicted Rossmann fold flavoprotein